MSNMGKPAHMPWLSPYFAVQNIKNSILFYQAAFGFTLAGEVITDSSEQAVHAALAYKDTLFMIGKEGEDR